MNSTPCPVVYCPTNPLPYVDNPNEFSTGCGSTNLDGPDWEGFYDCFDCGLFFKYDDVEQELMRSTPARA